MRKKRMRFTSKRLKDCNVTKSSNNK